MTGNDAVVTIGACTAHGGLEECIQDFGGKVGRKEKSKGGGGGRAMRRWENNIKIEVRGRYNKVVWTELFWLRLGTVGGPLLTGY
jgi:hypothetical protein